MTEPTTTDEYWQLLGAPQTDGHAKTQVISVAQVDAPTDPRLSLAGCAEVVMWLACIALIVGLIVWGFLQLSPPVSIPTIVP